MGGCRQTLFICVTELRAEWRNRQVITTMLLLAGLSVVTFGFAGRAGSTHLAPPALWVSLLLAAASGIAQIIARHDTAGVSAALRLGGAPRWAIFGGRLASFYLLLLLTAGLCWTLTALLFGAPVRAPGSLAALLALGGLGLATLSTTIAATVSASGSGGGAARLVPLLLLPLALPLLLLGARGTWGLEAGGGGPSEALALLALLDALLLGLGVGISLRS
jgi:heme exporter protein B